MLSVTSSGGGGRDGTSTKGLMLGFGGAGEAMDDSELEEGEACYGRDADADDATVDPDVALSYIDEKLEHVLGHFQKDFEGEVSTENLGAKFGMYGSFLPTYKRSPAKAQNPTATRSPYNPVLEAVRQNPKGGPADASSFPKRSLPPSVVNPGKRGSFPPVVLSPQHESTNKPFNNTDQKTLKVRIKLGPDNASTRNNAAIYSGLGLDISPSSSPEDSPMDSGGTTSMLCGVPNESPTTILQKMTSFPILGGCILSPLPDGLLRLVEKEKCSLKNGKPVALHRSSFETSIVVPDALSPMRNANVSKVKKLKPEEKTQPTAEMGENDIGSLSRNETDIETVAGRETVQNAFSIPILSGSRGTNEKIERQAVGEIARNSSRASSDLTRQTNKVVEKDQMKSPISAQDGLLEAAGNDNMNDGQVRNVPFHDRGITNSKPSLAEKGWEEKKASTHEDFSSDPEKEDRNRVNRNCDVLKANSDGFNKKDQDSIPVEYVKQKTTQDIMKVKDPLSVRKKKVKGRQSNGTPVEFPKEGLKAGVEVSKDKKKIGHVKNSSENMAEFSKALKESYRSPDIEQRDFPRGIKGEQSENQEGSLDGNFKNKAKDPWLVIEKETLAFSEKPRERVGGKKVKVSSTAEASIKVHTEASYHGVDPFTGAAVPPSCPVVIEENWVQCENCNKWRLLPFGSEPDKLPKKWLCSMLHWLPGMNNCSVSEEETTRALNALYQVPLPEGQTVMHGQHDRTASGVTLADGRHLDQIHQPYLHPMPGVAKKKTGSKDSSTTPSQTHLPNSSKKSQVVPIKCKSLNDVNQHPLYSNTSSKAASQISSKTDDLFVGKHGHKSKDKQKSSGRYSDEGNTMGSRKHSKSKSRRERDQDSMRASKKLKSEDMLHANEDWYSDRGISGKTVLNSCNGFPTTVNGESLQKLNEDFVKSETWGDSLATGKKMKAQSQVISNGDYRACIEASEMGNSDKTDLAAKKRKVKEFKSDQVYPETILGNGHLLADRSSGKEETKEIVRKEKKSRVSKTDYKEADASKVDGRNDKKGRTNRIVISGSREVFLDGTEGEKRDFVVKEHQMEKDQGNGVPQKIMDGMDSLRKDLGYAPSLTAATSSSSKVSGSHKSKGNFHEVKGSPVESVSSSPLRISNTDKPTSKRNLLVKDEPTMAFSTVGSPKRCSDGEADGGNNRFRTTNKAKAASVILHETLATNGDGEASMLGSSEGVLCHRDMDANQISGTKTKENMHLKAFIGTHSNHFPPEFQDVNIENGDAITSDQVIQCEHDRNNPCLDQEKPCSSHINGSTQQELKSNSLHAKNRNKTVKPDFERGRGKGSDSFSGQEDNPYSKNAIDFRYGSGMDPHGQSPYHEELRDEKCKFQVKSFNIHVKDQNNFIGREVIVGNTLSKGGKDGQTIVSAHKDLDVQESPLMTRQYKNFAPTKDLKSNMPESLHQVSTHEDERSSPGKIKSLPLAHFRDKQERQNQGNRVLTPAPVHGSKSEVLPGDVVNGEMSKLLKRQRHPDNQSGSHPGISKQPIPNGVGGRDIDAPSPVRKDVGHSAATVVLKEARDLKHSANRLKSSGLELESTGLYFQAALKFLYVASLMETSNTESARHSETQSIQMYNDTASLCEYCAHEYEKCKEMAAAALAYKCIEVAYMKVVYSKQTSASKDRHELQATLNLVPLGESPSSSASDVDNLNHLCASDKAALAKGTASLHVGGNIVIAARSRLNYMRLLNFTQDVNNAMEASRKSQSAFAVASSKLGETQYGLEGISSVRRVLDFNFHDVEGLLRLVRLAMEAISR